MKATQAKGKRARPPSLLPNAHFEWLQATRFVYYGNARWLPVLMEFMKPPKGRGLTADAFAQQVLAMQALGPRRQRWAAQLRIPQCYAPPGTAFGRRTRFIALLARPQFVADVYSGARLVDQVRRFEIGRAVVPSVATRPQAVLAALAAPGGPSPPVVPQVITAVVDDGIGFAHDRLFSADGTTRIEFFWDQQQPSTVWAQWNYGTEFSKADIDQRLSASRYGPCVDEDEVYRLSGQADHTQPGPKPLAARHSHGAHVADLACNRPGPGTPARPLPGVRPVIAVQLPASAVADTSGATLEPQIYNGLCYILHKTQELANRSGQVSLPVVANVSYGLIGGPHDGSGTLEAAIDQLLLDYNQQPGRLPARVVLPAGNNFLSRCHARFTLIPPTPHELAWRVLPDDWTESSLQIWLPAGANLSALSVLVTAPDGSTGTGPFKADGETWFDVGNDRVGQAWFHSNASTTQRASIRLWLAPTADPDGQLALAQAGVWRIQLDNRTGVAPITDIEAWIQRDDTAPGHQRRGRQSYFDDVAYQHYDDGGRAIEVDNASYVKREGSLNAIATGKLPVVAGGYRRSDGRPAPYSAAGPVRPPRRGQPNPDGPECMMPSDESPSQWGQLAAGTRSNSCVALQGTSVAAPQVAVALAEWAAQNSPNERGAVYAAAQAQEALLPPLPEPKPKQSRGGGGRVRTSSNRAPRREA